MNAMQRKRATQSVSKKKKKMEMATWNMQIGEKVALMESGEPPSSSKVEPNEMAWRAPTE